MASTIDNISESIKENSNSFFELIKERFFSPMYFYFIVSWGIINWKFIYVLLYTDESLISDKKWLLKIEFLSQLYTINSLLDFFIVIWKTLVFPAFFSYLAVWWFTRLSSKFYKKYEKFKQNKRVIDRELEYEEKVIFEKREREIRDAQADKTTPTYDENPDFNDYIDWEENVEVLWIAMQPSLTLYHEDFEAYKEELQLWKESQSVYEQKKVKAKKMKIDELKDELRDEIIQDHIDEERWDEQFMADRER